MPTKVNDEKINDIVGKIRHITVQHIGQRLKFSHTTNENLIRGLALTDMFDIWVAHGLK